MLKKVLQTILFFIFLAVPGWSQTIENNLLLFVPKANIRPGPGTQQDWIWQVGKYYPIIVQEKKGNWYFFRDFEGDEGWIHKSLLNQDPTVITTKNKCNLRSGPGTKFEIKLTVGLGIPFKVLEKKGNWIHVEHADGDKGWIHKSLVW